MICKKCGNFFKRFVYIDGNRRNLSNRKMCLECQPFKTKIRAKKIKIAIVKECIICGNQFTHKGGKCGTCVSKIRRTAIKSMAVEIKGGKCELCGWDKHLAALQFHHKNPNEKDFAISCSNKSWEQIKKELDKCILLCANCHSILHSVRFNDVYTELAEEYKNNFKPRKKRSLDLKSKYQPWNKDKECIQLRKVKNRPSKEELETMLWNSPTVMISKKYNVSDTTISKWAKQYGISKPPRGYWAKKYAENKIID